MIRTLEVPKKRRPRGDAVIILRDVPPTYHWGWFSREDSRMHVQAVDKKHLHKDYKVWLERDGRRVIEPEPGIPAKVWKALHQKILQERGMIEAYWIEFMIKNRWLDLSVANPHVTLVAYRQFPNFFIRTINLHDYIGNPATVVGIRPEDVVFNEEFAFLEIFPKRHEARRIHIPLVPILWT